MTKQNDNERRQVSPDEARKKAEQITEATNGCNICGTPGGTKDALLSLADQVEKFKESIFFEREFAVRLKTCGEELASARAEIEKVFKLLRTAFGYDGPNDDFDPYEMIRDLKAERDAAREIAGEEAARAKKWHGLFEQERKKYDAAVEVALERGNAGGPMWDSVAERRFVEKRIAAKLAEKREQKDGRNER